jgi:predicted transposase YbfD/YdcC
MCHALAANLNVAYLASRSQFKAQLDTQALKGCNFMLDAIGCQNKMARKIFDRCGDYLLAVKDNQETLAATA